MKRMLHISLMVGTFAVLAVSLTSGVVFAQTQLNARFALHDKAKFALGKNGAFPQATCPDGLLPYDPNTEGLPCSDYTTAGPAASPRTIYIVLARTDGQVLAGSFGLEYDRTNPFIANWEACGDGLEFPNDGGFGDFPAHLGGNRITYSTCTGDNIAPDGIHTVLGSFYMYAYQGSFVQVIANENLQSGAELGISPCVGNSINQLDYIAPELIPQVGGRVEYGGGLGYSPCNDIVDVTETSWGQLKNLYSND